MSRMSQFTLSNRSTFHDGHAHSFNPFGKPNPNEERPNLKIVKTEVEPTTGEAFQLVRPVPKSDPSTQDIISRLMKEYDYKKSPIKGERNDLKTVQAAFPRLANKLVETYDGSNIVTDTHQDLIGDKYLEEQIKRINEQNKKTSILDKWSHLFYEGEDEETYMKNKINDQKILKVNPIRINNEELPSGGGAIANQHGLQNLSGFQNTGFGGFGNPGYQKTYSTISNYAKEYYNH